MFVKRLAVIVCMFALFALTGSLVAQDATTFTVRIENISDGNSEAGAEMNATPMPETTSGS